MIIKHREELLDKFLLSWNQISIDTPETVLDGNWPSISVCDLILMPIVGKPKLTEADESMVTSIVMYLAKFVGECWRAAGLKSELTLKDGQISIIASDSGSSISCDFEQELRSLLSTNPYPLPMFRNYSRALVTNAGIIAPFTLGVTLGLSPSIEGPWVEQTEEEAKGRIERIVSHLAQTTARAFERCFPKELSGQIAEIYLDGAIYPPLGMRENYPGFERIKTFISGLTALGMPESKMLDLGKCLVRFADSQLSSLGLLLLGYLGNIKTITAVDFSNAERFGRSGGLLRPALVQQLTERKGITDWSRVPQSDHHLRVELESLLFFLPSIYLPAFELDLFKTDERVSLMYKRLCSFDLGAAQATARDIAAATPQLTSVRIQKAFVDLLLGQVEEADQTLRSLLSEPDCESDARIYSLLGMVSLGLNNEKDSARYFKIAFDYTVAGEASFPTVANDYGWTLLKQGDFKQAIELLDRSINSSRTPFTAMINKATALEASKDTVGASELLAKCRNYAPVDPRVFVMSYLR